MLHAVSRTEMNHDTRFFPVVQAPERDVVVFWFVLAGGVAFDSETHEAPALVSLSERDYHGARGRRFLHYRTLGQTFRALEVRARGRLLACPSPHATPLGGARLADVKELWNRVVEARAPAAIAEQLNAVLRHLPWAGQGGGPLRPNVPPERVVAWDAFRRVYESLDTSSSLKQLALLSGNETTARRIEGEVSLLLGEYLFPAASWRDLTSYTRLAFAAFLLSSNKMSVGEIAEAVGYAHPAAMTNAFRAAGLPTPSALRKLLHRR